MVSMDILDRQPTDPPKEPALQETLAALNSSTITVSRYLLPWLPARWGGGDNLEFHLFRN